ncbi:MAG: alpha/beta hydrolase [Acidimicrobiia bacterium]|nr:alpha/beta hydrolase [Acidimicrobiia bacterium]
MGVQRRFVSAESPTMPRAGHGSLPCQGLYWTPDGTAPTTALIATHYNVDFAEHYLAEHMAERGYGFLGWNTRYRGNETYFLLEHAVVDIGVGVRWLREQGVETVVLLGNSGGGSLMAAYQSQAAEPNLRPAVSMPMPDAALDLPRAELYVSLNAHLGRPEVLTAWLDPSVVDERDPLSRDPSLDMFDARHGPPYAPEFVDRYRAAQADRNDRISAWARAELDRLRQHEVWDTVFVLNRVWADLRFTDLSLDPSERKWGCYAGDPKRANDGPLGLGRSNTCRSWLSMWSLADSQCRAGPHLNRITAPSLLVQSLGDTGIFPSDAHAMFEAMGANDKTIELITGDHYFQHEGSRDECADLIAAWLQSKGA